MISDSVLEQLEFFRILEYISKNTYTERGKNLILSSRPISNLPDCLAEGDLVTEARDLLISYDYPPLSSLPDLTADLTRSNVENTALPQESILRIRDLAETSRNLFQYLKSKERAKNLFESVGANLYVDKNFEHYLSSVFNSRGEISDSASKNLREIRKSIIEKSDQLSRVVNSILKKLTENYLVQENFITLKEGRIVLPVKVEHKRHVKGFIHSESATGQTVYIEPAETLELNNEIVSLRFEERREIERILKQLTKRISEVSEHLKLSLISLAHIDSIFAKAKYSIEIVGAFPEFDESKPMNLLEGRHPILIKKLGKDKTVPLNIKIDKKNIVLITGPNAGGKTVVLKTVGILSLLAMSGFHIPVNPDSNFKFFEQVLIDIGDKQSIEDDLSTFSWHLSNIKNILESAAHSTLVLMDEVGTGTDPAEGSAIAAAMLIEFQRKGAIVLASTHHGNLKLAANELPGFQNASMQFDTEKLLPTYKFSQGIPGSSYAFEVAERIGYKQEFIELAKEHLDTNKNKIEEFLIDLEKKSHSYKEKLSKLEIENLRLTGLTNLYQSKIKELEEQKKDILKRTKLKAEEYLSNVNKKVEHAIKNIKENAASKTAIKEEKKNIEELKSSVKKLVQEESLPAVDDEKPFEIGDFVAIKDTTTSGTIADFDRQKGVCVIECGAIKLNVPIKNIYKTKKLKEVSSTPAQFYSPTLKSFRLDIRGMKPESAEYEIIKFLDDAYASGNNRIEILHGKGNGVLKNTAHTIIKSTDYVKKYYFADIEYGGDGITIIEFK